MARPRNSLGTKQLKYAGNKLIEAYLNDLVKTGFYGRSAGEAAERLISQGIKSAINDGTIKSRQDSGETE